MELVFFPTLLQDYDSMSKDIMDEFDDSKQTISPVPKLPSNVKLMDVIQSFLPWQPVDGRSLTTK